MFRGLGKFEPKLNLQADAVTEVFKTVSECLLMVQK